MQQLQYYVQQSTEPMMITIYDYHTVSTNIRVGGGISKQQNIIIIKRQV